MEEKIINFNSIIHLYLVRFAYCIFFILILTFFTKCNSSSKKELLTENSNVKANEVYETKDSTKKLLLSFKCCPSGRAKFNKESFYNFNYDSLFTKVEINPEPLGGIKAFREWIDNNYILPHGGLKS